MLTVALDLLRGLLFYVTLFAVGGALGWLILPPIEDRARMFLSIAGGGALLFLAVLIMLANVRIKP